MFDRWDLPVFLGINSLNDEGIMTLVDGTKFDYNDTTKEQYFVWKDGEPNNRLGNENCIEASPKMNDISCYDLSFTICEIRVISCAIEPL